MSGKDFALFTKAALWMVLLVAAVGCSSGGAGDPPTVPVMSEGCLAARGDRAGAADHGRYLWSYHMIWVDPLTNEFEVVPARQVQGHWNVLKWLEQGPCTDCLSIAKITSNPSGTKNIDVKIRHPFSPLNLTGFDVRGIAMFKGSHTFPVSGLTTPDKSAGDGELVNADGYTSLYNSATAGSGPGGFQGYIKGKFASFVAPSATLNGFKRYIADDPANTRNAFYAGDELVVTYEIMLPTTGFSLGYAVDASWAPPTTKPVTNPMEDFPPEANCPEPWKVTTEEEPIGQGLTDGGGSTRVVITVLDYQGKDSHHEPVVECPELFDGALSASFVQEGVIDGFNYASYDVIVENSKLAPVGGYKCLIRVEDDENATSPDWLDLSAYQVHTFQVNEMSYAWGKTWGAFDYDVANSVTVDGSGNTYVTGGFSGTVDFDPGSGVDNHSAKAYADAFLSTFDSSGNFLWARTWGGSGGDGGRGVAVDSSGNVYVTGCFDGTVDFNPGGGTENHSTNGFLDAFLSKFDSSGNFLWAKTWGGTSMDFGRGVTAVASATVYVTGCFDMNVDFDPGGGTDYHSSNGLYDVFLSKLDSSGNFVWAKTWGGTDLDFGYGVVVDGSGSVYVAGYFPGTVDFDPGSGVDNHSSNGDDDVFMSKLDSSGNLLWAKTWGGSGSDYGYGIALDGSGNVYVTGSFRDIVDFDPGSGVDNHSSNGESDVYLSKFNSSGNLLWAKTWGGSQPGNGYGVAVSSSGSVYVTGSFFGTADFDPGSGVDNRTSNGLEDAFLSKFDLSGNFLWPKTWGGNEYDMGYSVAVDGSGSVYVAGSFYATVDFDPGSAVDEYSSKGGQDVFLSKFGP